MIKIIFTIVIAGIILALIPTLVDWPNIPIEFSTTLIVIFKWLRSFNTFLPITELFILGSILITIEIGLAFLKLIGGVAEWWTGHKPPTDFNDRKL